MKTYYKIVNYENGVLKTVHHSINGSRELPTGKWIQAETKVVRDNSYRPKYTSGIHIIDDWEATQDYVKIFKKGSKFIIVPVKAKGIRKKKNSKKGVYLADQIKIIY